MPQWDLVEESFREADFLWARWQDVLDSPTHRLDDVAQGFEDRLLGALEGVRVGGDRTVEAIVVPALHGRRLRRVTVATCVATSLGATEPLLLALRTADAPRLDAIARGLACSRHVRWIPVLAHHLSTLPAAAQAAYLRAVATRAATTPAGLQQQLDTLDPGVQRAALRLCAAAQDGWVNPYIEWGLHHADVGHRIAAARAGMLRHVAGATEVALEVTARTDASADGLLPLLGLTLGERVLPRIRQRLSAGAGREAFDALACIGTASALDEAVRHLEDRAARSHAANAIATIAGSDRRCPGSEAPQDRVAAWIDDMRRDVASRCGSMRPGIRHLDGRPFEASSLPTALAAATTRTRRLLSLDLARQSRGRVHVTTSTWTAIQRAQCLAATLARPLHPSARAA